MLSLSSRFDRVLLVRLAWTSLGLSGLTLVLHALARWQGATVWDDAFIFQRYAQNVAAGHGVSFNASDGPAYGLTSLLYLVPVVMVRWVVVDPALASLVTSSICALVGVALLAHLGIRAAGGGAAGGLTAAAVAVVVASPVSAAHAVSGMDAWFGVAFIAALIGGLDRFEREPSRGWRVGLIAALALWIRPESVAFGAAVVFFAAVSPAPSHGRRQVLRLALALGLGVVGLLLSAWWYFGVALPLPFFTKASGVYGPGFRRVYRGVGIKELGVFAEQAWLLALPLLLVVARGPRVWWQTASATERGVAAATVTILVFHALVALPVMGMSARFYQPLLAPLVYLSGRALRRVAATWSVPTGAVALAHLASWMLVLPLAAEGLRGTGERLRHRLTVDTEGLASSKGPRKYWPGLDQLAGLPPLTIAATEVGFLGIVAARHRIVDIAGLNTAAFAFGPFDVDHLTVEERPDLVYLPHPDYKAMTAALETHDGFQRDYQVLSRRRVGGSHYGVAVRRDSPHAEVVLRAVDPRYVARKARASALESSEARASALAYRQPGPAVP
ncbi:MAG: hypothetical protein AAF715_30400 [Myxococcota bacterium]